MSDTDRGRATANRPPQVTVAGWVTILGSAFLVAGMFDAVARLRSIESQESIKESLSKPPFDGLSLDVDGVQQVLHTVFVVAGGLGAAACVLGWFVLQRHKQARLALSVVAVPLFVSGFFSGSLAASLVAVSAMLLWSGPSRDWFAGRPVRKPALLPPPRQQSRPQSGPGQPSGQRPPQPLQGPPAPPAPSTRVSAAHLPPVPPGVASDVPPPYAGYGAPRVASPFALPEERPPALVAAVVITWVASAAVLMAFAAFVFFVLNDPAGVKTLLEQQQSRVDELGLTDAQLRQLLVVTGLLFIGWALVAALLALLVMLRVAWARPLLVISAIASGLLSCLMAAAVAPVVTAAAGMVSAYLLLRPEVGRWVNRR